ncbi:glycosyltransferase [Acetobacter sp. AN02]|uniref:glycosyltransferase n=1 Tax=Acetobacter sp. AN02 TaxID=2894186 RepID=UPI00243448A0|nr:glycosyltransferase [Acetobacter sp. AN02]MDG6095780.1 glycosyltransferase [Acetobacter sp. AN02]
MQTDLISVAAVIVTFNRLGKLRHTLEKTLAQPFSHVVVIDNASDDGTGAYLQEQTDSRLLIVTEAVNLGGAGGFARGFETVVSETAAQWLVCFDDDAFPGDGALEAFSRLNLDKTVGGVASAVYFPDDTICPMNRPGLNVFQSLQTLWTARSKTSGLVGVEDKAYAASTSIDVAFSSFVGLFVRCDLIRGRLGLPRTDLFIYRDDSLYTLNMTSLGYRLLFAPDLHFIHDCGTPSSGRRVYKPLWKAYYIIRNDIPFFRQFSGHYFYLLFPVLMMKWLISAPFYPDPLKFLRLALLAISDGIKGNFSTLHQEITDFSTGSSRISRKPDTEITEKNLLFKGK